MLFVLFIVAEPLHAEFIGVFDDSTGCPCGIFDKVPGLVTIAVLHVNSSGTTGSRFAVPQSACMELVWLAEVSVFPGTTGNSQTGISIDYGQCHTGTFQVLTIQYFGSGLTEDCCYIEVLPDPSALSEHIEIINCNKETVFISEFRDRINTDGVLCYCDWEPVCYPVATESSTWGKIKALYK
jgi:hypothetical protein